MDEYIYIFLVVLLSSSIMMLLFSKLRKIWGVNLIFPHLTLIIQHAGYSLFSRSPVCPYHYQPPSLLSRCLLPSPSSSSFLAAHLQLYFSSLLSFITIGITFTLSSLLAVCCRCCSSCWSCCLVAELLMLPVLISVVVDVPYRCHGCCDGGPCCSSRWYHHLCCCKNFWVANFISLMCLYERFLLTRTRTNLCLLSRPPLLAGLLLDVLLLLLLHRRLLLLIFSLFGLLSLLLSLWLCEPSNPLLCSALFHAAAASFSSSACSYSLLAAAPSPSLSRCSCSLSSSVCCCCWVVRPSTPFLVRPTSISGWLCLVWCYSDG